MLANSFIAVAGAFSVIPALAAAFNPEAVQMAGQTVVGFLAQTLRLQARACLLALVAAVFWYKYQSFVHPTIGHPTIKSNAYSDNIVSICRMHKDWLAGHDVSREVQSFYDIIGISFDPAASHSDVQSRIWEAISPKLGKLFVTHTGDGKGPEQSRDDQGSGIELKTDRDAVMAQIGYFLMIKEKRETYDTFFMPVLTSWLADVPEFLHRECGWN